MPRADGILAGGIVALAAVLTLSGCGGEAGGGRTFGTITDCATVGPLAIANDPAGDQRDDRGRRVAVPVKEGDLRRLRIARRGNRLCAEFTVAGTVSPATAYVLALRPQGTDTPLVQLEATVLGGQSPKTLLSVRKGGPLQEIEATVGIQGDRITVLADRSIFASHGLGTLFDAFRFQARTATADEHDRRLNDCLPACV